MILSLIVITVALWQFKRTKIIPRRGYDVNEY